MCVTSVLEAGSISGSALPLLYLVRPHELVLNFLGLCQSPASLSRGCLLLDLMVFCISLEREFQEPDPGTECMGMLSMAFSRLCGMVTILAIRNMLCGSFVFKVKFCLLNTNSYHFFSLSLTSWLSSVSGTSHVLSELPVLEVLHLNFT